MTMDAPQRIRVLQGLHLGLPNYWYPILRAQELTREKPLGIKRFGEELLLWRDEYGKPHVLEDRCAHRAVRLSTGAHEKGKIQGDSIACWYHGWTFNAQGQCTHIPSEVNGSICNRYRIKAYPTQERAGFIWMYFGSGEPSELTTPYELEDPEWCGFQTHLEWHTNWLNIMDNLSDPLHQYFLHAGAYTTRRRLPFNRVRVAEQEDDRVRIVQYLVDDQEQVEAEEPFGFEINLPSRVRVDLLSATPFGNVRVFMMMTPIDDNSSLVYYFRGMKATGLARLRWQLFWHLKYRKAVYKVADQDEAMLSEMGPLEGTRGREHLATSDVGVINLRRMLNRAWQRANPPGSSPQGRKASSPGCDPAPDAD